jgi:S-DNA-T family DNA segregation ATPase FtsK/SpoIIIE
MSTSFVGRRVPATTVPVGRQPLRLPLLLLIPWWLLKLLVRLLLVIAGSPVAVTILTVVTLSWAAWRLVSPLLVLGGFLLLAGALVGVRIRWPAFFERRIRLMLRSRWRRWSIYRYKWPATMDFAELNRYRSDGSQYEPVLLSVRSTRSIDSLSGSGPSPNAGRPSRGGLGQPRLPGPLCARPAAQIELWFLIDDPLQRIVEPHEHEVPVNLAGLPVGLREDGETYRLPLLGSHVLAVGRPARVKAR